MGGSGGWTEVGGCIRRPRCAIWRGAAECEGLNERV